MSDSLYKLLSEDERILSVTSFIGTSSPRFQATYAPNLAGKNYAQFIVNTASIEATRSVLDDYTDRYADYFPDAYVKFKQLDYQTYPLLRDPFHGRRYRPVEAGWGFLDGRVA